MGDFNSGFGSSAAANSYPGPLPSPPTPPGIVPNALSAAAPALGNTELPVLIIVSGDINVTTSFTNASVQRR